MLLVLSVWIQIHELKQMFPWPWDENHNAQSKTNACVAVDLLFFGDSLSNKKSNVQSFPIISRWHKKSTFQIQNVGRTNTCKSSKASSIPPKAHTNVKLKAMGIFCFCNSGCYCCRLWSAGFCTFGVHSDEHLHCRHFVRTCMPRPWWLSLLCLPVKRFRLCSR